MGPIETDIRPPGKRGRPAHPVTDQMKLLAVGESFALDTMHEYMIARSAQTRLAGKFSVCKVPGVGWRVWRTA